MEALLEKEGTVESWNDERLDELSHRMDIGFEKTATKVELAATKGEMYRRFDEVDARLGRFERTVEAGFDRLSGRLDKLTFGIIGILGAFVAAAFATLLASVMA
jgi:hypothetical protein